MLPVFTFTAVVAGGGLLFEDGYTVSTVLDGYKSNIKVNPRSILHQSPPSDLFILLDSTASTFYSLSLSTTSNGMFLASIYFYFFLISHIKVKFRCSVT